MLWLLVTVVAVAVVAAVVFVTPIEKIVVVMVLDVTISAVGLVLPAIVVDGL